MGAKVVLAASRGIAFNMRRSAENTLKGSVSYVR